jgi:hypothetical protein
MCLYAARALPQAVACGAPNRAQRRRDARRTRLPVRSDPRRLGLEAQPDERLVLAPLRLRVERKSENVIGIMGALDTG